jgi:hypothetical protein
VPSLATRCACPAGRPWLAAAGAPALPRAAPATLVKDIQAAGRCGLSAALPSMAAMMSVVANGWEGGASGQERGASGRRAG